MYQAASSRYETIPYRRCGASGLKLGAFSLGLWHNFGDTAPYENYGPQPGAAEELAKIEEISV